MIGFSFLSFEKICEVFPEHKCELITFSTNPVLQYENVKNKSSKVFVMDLITAKYLAIKFNRKLEGFVVIKDSFYNLKESKITSVDVSSSGLTVINYNSKLNLDFMFSSKTKFPKSFIANYKEKGYDLIVSSLLSKKKAECTTLVDLAEEYRKVYSGKDYKEKLCKAITNHIDYKELDTKKTKFSTKVKKFLIQNKMYFRAVLAFQDMMYNLTSIETAVTDISANKEDVLELLSFWNPIPKQSKEITFRFNKKPLPKNKRTAKRLERWSKQKHDIPKVVFKKRKEVFNKNKKKHITAQDINFIEHSSGLISVKSFLEDMKSILSNPIKDYYILGSTIGDSIKLRKGNVISILKKNSNDIIYVKVI